MSEIQLTPSGQPTRDSQGVLQDVRTAAPETKPEETKPDASLLNEPEAEEKPEEVKAGAPETYEDFKAPEGFELDKAVVDKAIPIFKELGLSQEGAQKLVDFYSEISKAAADAPIEYFLEERKEWKNAVNSDPEIGGVKLAQTKATINQALNSVLSKADATAFREAMDFTGAGDHPAFIKAFHKMASLLTETPSRDHVLGNGPSKDSQSASGRGERPSAASAIYPNLS